jgi:hypothetical protein
MRVFWNSDQKDMANTVDDFFRREAPLERNLLAVQSESGFDPRLYRQMTALGFLGTDRRSVGNETPFGLLAPVAHAIGYQLVPGPWLEQVLVIRLLQGCENLSADLAARVSDGGEFVSLPLRRDDWSSVSASGALPRLRVSGMIRLLGFATQVDSWIVPIAGADSIIRLVRVPASPADATEIDSIDPLWRGAAVTLTGRDAEVVGTCDARAAQRALYEATVLLAMAAIGGAQRLLDIAVEYLKAREAFGRPIGAFQALKHRAADQFIAIEHFQNLALAAFVEDSEIIGIAAKVAADDVYQRAAKFALQMHGASGFTWDVPIHYFLKASLRQSLLPVPTPAHREVLGQMLLTQEPRILPSVTA